MSAQGLSLAIACLTNGGEYDPKKQIALAVDEWGAWFDSEKDAPSQLYLKSTLRDAGMSLNIFNNPADRVCMANIAQMVNVIPSLFLTDGAKMVVTPTWLCGRSVQGASECNADPGHGTAPDYVEGTVRLPGISMSASKDAAGLLHLSIVNLDPVPRGRCASN